MRRRVLPILTDQKRLAESLEKKGNDVIVIARSLTQDTDEVVNGVRVIRVFNEETDDTYNDYYSYREKVSNKLRDLQKHNEIEIIEVPDWGAETVLFEKYRKIPLVVRLHTPLAIWSKANMSTLEPRIHKQMLRWEKKMIENADKVTSCTEIDRKSVV